MKITKNSLIAAAVAGALAGYPLLAHADAAGATSGPSVDKQGCNGKAGAAQGSADASHKESCQGKDHQGKDTKQDGAKDKSACAGKDGCAGKDKRS
ncbi:MAG: hypothetical protein HY899_10245 [Deltaproteobacteria bacterium]|nr:hypothetical protein [Deltaproteobacteria bacterium]